MTSTNVLSSELTRQSSLQPPRPQNGAGQIQVKRHSSMSAVRKQSLGTALQKKPSVIDIPEVRGAEEKEEEDVSGGYVKHSARKVSSVSRHSDRSAANPAFADSRSSLHGSTSSLPVIREQYCCCQRWTRLERYLAALVAVLALVIVGLVIAVGCLVGRPSDISSSHLAFKF